MKLYDLYFSAVQQVLKRTWGKITYNDYSSVNAAGIITAFQMLNLYYLLENVLFADSRGCGHCNAESRLSYESIFTFMILGFNFYRGWKISKVDSFVKLERRRKVLVLLAIVLYMDLIVYLVV